MEPCSCVLEKNLLYAFIYSMIMKGASFDKGLYVSRCCLFLMLCHKQTPSAAVNTPI